MTEPRSHLLEIEAMLRRSGRLLRSASNRVGVHRVARRLRHMGARRLRAAKALGRQTTEARRTTDVAIPGSRHLLALASPGETALLHACIAHERGLIHELNAELDLDHPSHLQQALRRVRNRVERDASGLRTWARDIGGGHRSPPGVPAAEVDGVLP